VREVRTGRTRLTQAQLGDLVGVTRQTINAIEGGDYAPSVYLALAIAAALDATVEDLFPRDREVVSHVVPA
jgi:putative transcriptional regulator